MFFFRVRIFDSEFLLKLRQVNDRRVENCVFIG